VVVVSFHIVVCIGHTVQFEFLDFINLGFHFYCQIETTPLSGLDRIGKVRFNEAFIPGIVSGAVPELEALDGQNLPLGVVVDNFSGNIVGMPIVADGLFHAQTSPEKKRFLAVYGQGVFNIRFFLCWRFVLCYRFVCIVKF